MDLSINLPEEIATPIGWLTEHIKALGKPRRGQIELKLREWGDGFMDVLESERQFQAEIAESISEDRRIKELSKALNKLVLTFREKNL